MNGTRESVAALLSALKQSLTNANLEKVDCAVFAPFPFLQQVEAQLSGSMIAWGAQTLSAQKEGAFTGEVSAAMLRAFGCAYVLIGHSECRQYHNESNELLAKKYQQAVSVGLKPILCVGETLAERERGETDQIVATQVEAILNLSDRNALNQLVIAYEPVWAIGTGKTATPQEAQAVHAKIRALVARTDEALAQRVQILYGGSVNPANASALFAMPDIDGGLIGGASLKANDFVTIVNAAAAGIN